MAYSTTNPPALTSQRVGAAGGAVWVYKDGDSLSTIAGIDYVKNATDLGIKAGDRVVHVDSTTGVTTDLVATTGQTKGTAVGATTNAAGYSIGDSVITLASAGTGTLLIGDVVTIGTDTTRYVLTAGDADVSDGGTFTVSPVLVVAISAAATAITVKNDVINLTSGASGINVISGSGATRLLTAGESGATILFDRAAGISYTLPPAVVGLKYKFMTTVSLTSNAYAVLTSTATVGDFFVGAVEGAIEGAATGETHFANGSTHLGISSNKTTTGGLIGGYLEIECVSTSLWSINGVLSCTATPATPFTT